MVTALPSLNLGFQAMKFCEVDAGLVEHLIDNPRVVFEQKFDGTRVFAEVFGRTGASGPFAWFFQSSGKPLAHSAAVQHLEPIREELMRQFEDVDMALLDGELMIRTGEYRLFDCPRIIYPENPDGSSSSLDHGPGAAFATRREALVRHSWPVGSKPMVGYVAQAKSSASKRRLFEAVRSVGGEGIISKDVLAPYEEGKRVKHTVKIKFVKTADVIVLEVDRPDAKHGHFVFGVAVSLIGKGVEVVNGQLVQILGKCSAIGKPEARRGDVIEVAYLYREPESGGLVQPRMMRIREDKDPAECTIDQFPAYSRDAVEL